MFNIRKSIFRPQRQARISILFAILQTGRRMITQFLLPVLAIWFFGGRSESANWAFFLIFISFSIISLIFAVLRFYTMFFYIRKQHFVVHEGFFEKKLISVPLSNIQGIDIQQNILQKWFNAASIRFDTSSADLKELDIKAIHYDTAIELKQEIINSKSTSQQTESTHQVQHDIETNINQTATPIVQYSLKDIITIALVQNHFRTFFIAAAFLLGLLEQFSDESLWKSILYKLYNLGNGEIPVPNFGYVIFMLVGLLIILILVTIIRMVFLYYNLKLKHKENTFVLKRGLYNKIEQTVSIPRIVKLDWKDNILLRWFKLQKLHIYSPHSELGNTDKQLIIPGINTQQLKIIEQLYHDDDNAEVLISCKPHKTYRLLTCIVFMLMTLWLIIISNIPATWILILFLWVAIALYYLSGQTTTTMFYDTYIKQSQGIFQHKTTMIKYYKLQQIELIQSQWMKLFNVKSLLVSSAAGNIVIPYINQELAMKQLNALLYIIDSQQLSVNSRKSAVNSHQQYENEN